MAQIINFSDLKKDSNKPSFDELVVSCTEVIGEDWERSARNNKLNQFFLESVPTWSNSDTNYLQDLNALSVIESKIGLTLILLAPGSTNASQLGWVAGFALNGKRVETPYMFSEQYARCFNILLFLKLGREMSRAGVVK